MTQALKHILVLGILLLTACSAVKMPVNNQYQLTAFSTKQLTAKPSRFTLLVSAPDAAAAYQTEAMVYTKKAYQLETFANNAWTAPPADMFYPLLVQSLQRSGYFDAVSSGPYTEGADYRLDTQLLSLQQNFLTKPSTMEFSFKVVLTDVNHNKIIASRVFSERLPCSENTPYGGVVAANLGAEQMTAAITRFVIKRVQTSQK